jgi:hypothetical protein
MSDVKGLETGDFTPERGNQEHNPVESRRIQNLQNVKRVLEEIGQGRSPIGTIVDGTSPRYWIIRTANQDYRDENTDDRWSLLDDQISTDHHELWVERGGTGSGLRFGADPEVMSFIGHVAVRVQSSRKVLCSREDGLAVPTFSDGWILRANSARGLMR